MSMKLYGFHQHRDDCPWDSAPSWAIEMGAMLRALLKEEEVNHMVTRQTLDALKAEVSRDTDAVSAATAALTHYAQTNADLTKQLQDALANASSTDDAEVQNAVAALKANNDALTAAAPAVAQDVVANTPAAPAAPAA